MAKIIETEMEGCLEEMAKLEDKMKRLQEEAAKEAEEEVTKKTEIEPNLKIMSDWLYEYGEVIEEGERDRVIIDQYNKYKDGIISDPEEIKCIDEKYTAYKSKLKKNMHLNRHKRREYNVPLYPDSKGQAYFMKQYIEATHNMFLIQQKRINELEKKIEEINLKL